MSTITDISVQFAWPELLWLLAALPLMVALYLWLLRRRKQAALRWAHLALVKAAIGPGMRIRRHLPPLLFLVALAAMIVAIARPSTIITLPSAARTIILAMDVSGSMRAKDVEPSRLEAAQAAAKAFIAEMPPTLRVGVVAFAGTASVVQPPTSNKQDVIDAIDRFQLQRGTATGSGIIVSLATLFPDQGINVSNVIYGKDHRGGRVRELAPEKAPVEVKPVPAGSYDSAAIILLTDGQRTTGPDPELAAKMAADRGVRVFSVGIGTPDGEVIGFEGWSFRARLDEASLKSIAAITKGEYFYAGTAKELKHVYQSLNTRIVFEKKYTEVTALVSALAAALALLAAGFSVFWFGRIL